MIDQKKKNSLFSDRSDSSDSSIKEACSDSDTSSNSNRNSIFSNRSSQDLQLPRSSQNHLTPLELDQSLNMRVYRMSIYGL